MLTYGRTAPDAAKLKIKKKKLKKWKLQQVQQEEREARDTVIRNRL
ncbi:MAG: hypothetical protein PHI47_10460 [Sulfuricurvum sp.]|nr:hypothetical protein [Sulfuricurvum sp.]MDD5160463.1 hypothetical protein [Sulfuricurvum sp.]